MKNRTHILFAIALIIILAVLGNIMQRQIPLRIDLPFDTQATGMAAEFARDAQELLAVVGAQHQYSAAIRTQQYLDFAFIPCYAALFAILALALRRYDIPAPSLLSWIIIGLAVAAGAFDVGENLAILKAMEPNTITSDARWYALPKWGLVFAVMLLESTVFVFWPKLTIAWRIGGVMVGTLLLFVGAAGLLFTLLVSIDDIIRVAGWMGWALVAALVFLIGQAFQRQPGR